MEADTAGSSRAGWDERQPPRLYQVFGTRPLVWFVQTVVVLVVVAMAYRFGLTAWQQSSCAAAFCCANVGILLLTAGKQGAGLNYVIEPWAALVLWLANTGLTVGHRAAGKRLVTLALTITVAWQLVNGWGRFTFAHSPARKERLVSYRQEVLDTYADNSIDRQRVLNLVMPQFATTLRIRHHFNDPILYRLLVDDKLLDAGPMINCLRQGFYAAVVLPEAYGRRVPNSDAQLRQLVDIYYRPFFRDSFDLVHYRPRRAAGPPQVHLPQ